MAQLPVLLQTGTFECLLTGIFEGDTPVSTLLQHGDFGLGTYNGLDGELIILDGNCYRIDGEGSVSIAEPARKVPFATVTHFQEETLFTLENINSFDALTETLDESIASKNYPYAIRIDGIFSHVQVRSLKPSPKPYKPLQEILGTIQTRFDLEETAGTIVGFYFPSFMERINVPGYHLHYIDEEKKQGGHLFDLEIKEATVRLCEIKNQAIHFPTNTLFKNASFDRWNAAALHKVENDR